MSLSLRRFVVRGLTMSSHKCRSFSSVGEPLKVEVPTLDVASAKVHSG